MLYKPKKSYAGWLGLIGCIVIFGFTLWGINFSLGEKDQVLKIMLLVPVYLFMIVYAVFLLGAFNLVYKTDEKALYIRWGIFRQTITWDKVEEVVDIKGKPNINPFIGASWRGYAAGLFSAKGMGFVKMFATDISSGLIYVKSGLDFYGLTPSDHSLLDEISSRSGKPIRTIDVSTLSLEEKGESLDEDHSFKLYYRLNIIFLAILAAIIGIGFPGSGAPRIIVLLLVLAVALFAFNVGNAKRLYQFSELGSNVTLIITLFVTGMFIVLATIGIWPLT